MGSSVFLFNTGIGHFSLKYLNPNKSINARKFCMIKKILRRGNRVINPQYGSVELIFL